MSKAIKINKIYFGDIMSSFKFYNFLYVLFLVVSPLFSGANQVKIGFFLREISVRGVELSVFNYADCNETILGNESYIFYINYCNRVFDGADYIQSTQNMFKERFGDRFFECSSFDEVEQIIKEKGIDIFYNLKSGGIDEHVSKNCKNAVHAVFNHLEIHGDAYATISEFLSQLRPELNLPVVPHMIRVDQTKDNLRQKLSIPKNAVVFGRHGGRTTFDIPFAVGMVVRMAKLRPDWYFLFMNTDFPDHFKPLPKNIIFLKSTTDQYEKALFINTCDAMIHARSGGETFGLACGEFSIKNKPVITSIFGDQCHSMILKDKAKYFSNRRELVRAMEWCAKNIDAVRSSNWDAYSVEFSPEKVMEKFDQVFIQPLIKK